MVERATSFGLVAGDYEAGRPTYPREGIVWLAGAAERVVVDLGAGTGKLSQGLIGCGYDVVAVEPLLPMIGRLRDLLPAARAIAGAAEAMPLRDGCADAVLVAQALHWFDLGRALPEIHRVLRAGGILGMVWNARDESLAWVRELSEMLERGGYPRRRREESRESHERAQRAVEAAPSFGAIEQRVLRFEQTLDLDALLALVRSRSHVAMLPDEGRAGLLESVRSLWRTHPQLAGKARVALPYLTFAYRVTRL